MRTYGLRGSGRSFGISRVGPMLPMGPIQPPNPIGGTRVRCGLSTGEGMITPGKNSMTPGLKARPRRTFAPGHESRWAPPRPPSPPMSAYHVAVRARTRERPADQPRLAEPPLKGAQEGTHVEPSTP
jgi:hypothetical protein